MKPLLESENCTIDILTGTESLASDLPIMSEYIYMWQVLESTGSKKEMELTKSPIEL